MKNIWYERGSYGINVFFNVGKEYFKIHGVFPRTRDQLPNFLTSLGYPCKATMRYIPSTMGGEPCMIESHGLKMKDETATALVLRFGL